MATPTNGVDPRDCFPAALVVTGPTQALPDVSADDRPARGAEAAAPGHLPQPPIEEFVLGGVARPPPGLAVGGQRLVVAPGPPQQVGPGRVIEVVVGQRPGQRRESWK